MLIQEFKHKLTPQLQNRLNSGVELPTSISALAKRCLSIYKQMQATDRIKDRTKPQATQITPVSVSIKEVAHQYQRPVINTHANTSFSHLFSSIMRTMTPTLQHLDEERACWMKESRYFSYKERGHTTYDCLRKRKIAAILESVSKDSNSQGKE